MRIIARENNGKFTATLSFKSNSNKFNGPEEQFNHELAGFIGECGFAKVGNDLVTTVSATPEGAAPIVNFSKKNNIQIVLM